MASFVELHALRADQVLQGPSIVKTIVPFNAAADNVVPLEDAESPLLIIGSKRQALMKGSIDQKWTIPPIAVRKLRL